MKTCKKLLALLLALAMVFAFAACGGNGDDDNDKKGSSNVEETKPQETNPPTEPPKEEEKIYGQWGMEIDITENMNDTYAALFGESFVIPESPVYVNMNMEFEEDGDFSIEMVLDVESFNTYMSGIASSMIDFLLTTYESLGLSREDAEAELGMTLEEYVEMSFADSSDLIEESFEAMDIEGCYKLVEGELFLAEDEDDLEDEENSMTITVDGDKMEISDIDGDDLEEIEELIEEGYGVALPWAFEKQ